MIPRERRRVRRMAAGGLLAGAALALALAATAMSAAAGVSSEQLLEQPQIVSPDTQVVGAPGFGATSSAVAFLGEPLNPGISTGQRSRLLIAS